MAKSNLDKLKDTIAEITALLSQVEIGDDRGQYPQQSADLFKEAVAAAEALVITEDASPSQFEAQTIMLNDARSSFMDTRNPMTRKVRLRGTPSQCIGPHTIHFKDVVVNFVDGEAQLPDELADQLVNDGYAE
ncbi:hypothetical protein [Paenibacillus sp. BAC0078]